MRITDPRGIKMEERRRSLRGQYGFSDRLGPRRCSRAKTESSVHTEKGEEESRTVETKGHRSKNEEGEAEWKKKR